MSEWRDVTQLALGDDFLIGLRKDGTVVAAGENDTVCNGVTGWQDIIQIAAVSEAAAGLTAAGTVVRCGNPRYLRYEGMEQWRNIRELIAFQNGG